MQPFIEASARYFEHQAHRGHTKLVPMFVDKPVHYSDWNGLGDISNALVFGIPAEWISESGREFWMIFSATNRDQFNLVRGTFLRVDPIR